MILLGIFKDVFPNWLRLDSRIVNVIMKEENVADKFIIYKDPLKCIHKYHNITCDNKVSLSITKTHFPLIISNDTGQESFTLNPNNLAVLKFTNILVEIYFCKKEYFPQADKIDFTVAFPNSKLKCGIVIKLISECGIPRMSRVSHHTDSIE